ncbi:hypothetical protein EZS27_042824, partial [termite gut metagenome]
TFTVEGYNSRIRHYLARFKRKGKCYSKAQHMIDKSLKLLFLKVKNFLKSNYPPPKEVAFRSIYGYATENSLNVKGKAGITLPPAKQVGF